MENFYNIDELDETIAQNKKVILNQVAEKPTGETKEIPVKKESGELEVKIMSLLKEMPDNTSGCKEMFAKINLEYPDVYTNKNVTDKMWNMCFKKGLLEKVSTGRYKMKGKYNV